MNILLLGEYSGLHNALRDGLSCFGVKAVVASDGDSWKNFPTDINFTSPFSSGSNLGRVFKNIKPFFLLPDIKKYKLVQLINPMVLTPRFGINTVFVDAVLERANEVFLLGAGPDAFYNEAQKKFRYSPLPDYKSLDNQGAMLPFETDEYKRLNRRILDRAKGVLPVAYDLWAGYADSPKVHPVIPMPVNTDKYLYKPNIPNTKIIFFHGINQAGYKGSKYIISAIEIMRKRYGDVAEFIVADRMPISEYTQVIERANVIIDQALSYSYGMNALISMSMGKVVMSGAEDEIHSIYGSPNHPVINIKPDVDQICDQIASLIKMKTDIPALGEASRAFVERVHSHVVIAEKFMKAWRLQ